MSTPEADKSKQRFFAGSENYKNKLIKQAKNFIFRNNKKSEISSNSIDLINKELRNQYQYQKFIRGAINFNQLFNQLNDKISLIEKIKPHILVTQVEEVCDCNIITISTRLDSSQNIQRFNVRLQGIYTPKFNPSKINKSDQQIINEQKAASLVKDSLEQIIKDKFVILENIGQDRQGRVLADAQIYNENTQLKDDDSINNMILNRNWAVKYDENKPFQTQHTWYSNATDLDKKLTPKDWMKYLKKKKINFKRL